MHIAALPEVSEAKPNRRSGNAVLCHATTAEPVVRQCASTKRAKWHKAGCALPDVRWSCTILSSFARHRAGGERRWSGSAIGAAWLSERAPIAQSGSNGHRKHRAQACFILALLYSRAPWWVVRLGVQKRRLYAAFAAFSLPACFSIAPNSPCRCEGRQSAASEAMLLAAMPRSNAACRWPASHSITLHCPCRCKAPEQQAVERSGVACGVGDEAMRQMLACFCTLVHKGAMLGGAAGVQKRRRYSAFAPYGLPACSSIALKLCGLPVACLLGSSTGTHGALPVRVLGWTALKPLLSKWRSTSVALSAPATELACYRSFALSEAKRLDCHAPKQYGCRWPACLALASCCPCRCKALEQQAVERSGVAGCGGNEAMRLLRACCGTLVLKGAMLGGEAGRA